MQLTVNARYSRIPTSTVYSFGHPGAPSDDIVMAGKSLSLETAELQIVGVGGLDQEQLRLESLLGNTYANVVPAPELTTCAPNILSLLTTGLLVWNRRRSNAAHS